MNIALSAFFYLFFLTNFLFSQNNNYSTESKKAINHFEEALKYYDAKQNIKAKEELEKAIKTDDNFIEAHILFADIYTDLGDVENAIAEYKKAIKINPDFFPNLYYSLGKIEMKTAKYEDAKIHFDKFLTYQKINQNLAQKAKRNIDVCSFAIKAIANPVIFKPLSLGDSINTYRPEYCPALTADEQTLYFTKRDSNNQEDIYVSKKLNNQWTEAVNVGYPINMKDRNEGAVSISADGQTMFFAAAKRFEKMDIYMAKKYKDYWQEPKKIGLPINTEWKESQPCISSDGKTLYFISDRPGGMGKLDIWKSTLLSDGSWSVAVNLGKTINTTENDQSPFMHPDNKTFYFTSQGWIGMGGYDFFYSKLDENGNFDSPINLGYPINTANDERSLIVTANGKNAFYASEGLNNTTEMDIYSFELYKEAQPENVTYVKGSVYDSNTRKKLEAYFELIDLESSKTIIEAYSNKGDGKFLMCLPTNKNYALNVSCKGYLFYSENFSLKNLKDKEPFIMDIGLKPIQVGENMVLKNIFFETNDYTLKTESKAELKKLLEFLNSNPDLQIEVSGHTDNVGDKIYNQILSEKRAKTVSEYLTQHGVQASRVKFKGYGDTKPVNNNETDEGRQLNRRTEFLVIGN